MAEEALVVAASVVEVPVAAGKNTDTTVINLII